MILLSVLSSIVLAVATALLAAAYARQRARGERLQAELDRFRSEAAQREKDLQQRTEMDSVKDEFISTVSHELRTPLTSIRGALGLLSAGLMGKVDDKAANLLRIASTNTDRLVRLINDILDLERMSSGSAPLQPRTCSVRELVLQAVDTMSAMADAAQVQLEARLDIADAPVMLEADPDRIQQVLTNLFSNAIKFSPPGSSVRVGLETRAGEVTIRVEDGGRGVPAAKLETIFERFQQVEASDSRQKGGTGLGLAICRSIVQQHGGHIWAERNDATLPGQPGTTFAIRLPRPEAATAPSTASAAPATYGTILMVDDDPSLRHALAESVRRQGYNVLETKSGQDALQIASNQTVEAIFLDPYMPGVMGWETVERLKLNPVTAAIPIVVLNVVGPASGASARVPLIGRAQGWMQKPANPSLLIAQLSRVLHRGGGPARILLVENDADLAAVVLSSFQHPSLKTEVHLDHARSLGEAVASCEAETPDIIVLDLGLPEGSGFALVKWLRQQPKSSTLPLVVYSGREFDRDEMPQLRLGPTQFLAKARIQPKEVEALVFAMVRQFQSSTPERISA